MKFLALSALFASATAIDFGGLKNFEGFKLDLDPKNLDFGSIFGKEKYQKEPNCIKELNDAALQMKIQSTCKDSENKNAPDFQSPVVNGCSGADPSDFDTATVIRSFLKLQQGGSSGSETYVLNDPEIVVGLKPFESGNVQNDNGIESFYEDGVQIKEYSTGAMGPEADKWKCSISANGQVLTCKAKGEVVVGTDDYTGLQFQVSKPVDDPSICADWYGMRAVAHVQTACGQFSEYEYTLYPFGNFNC